jgi:hypothetical protein
MYKLTTRRNLDQMNWVLETYNRALVNASTQGVYIINGPPAARKVLHYMLTFWQSRKIMLASKRRGKS